MPTLLQPYPIDSIRILFRNHGLRGDDDSVCYCFVDLLQIFVDFIVLTSTSCIVWTTARAAGTATTCVYPFPSSPLHQVSTPSRDRQTDVRRRPSRFGAQSEAVNIIFNSKTGANPESSVGLMSMGGKTPEVLVTLTTDIGKVLDGLHRTKIWGEGHLSTAVQVAGVMSPSRFRISPPPASSFAARLNRG